MMQVLANEVEPVRPAVDSIRRVEEQLLAAGLANRIMVDCSHANCNKDPNTQPEVARAVVQQILEGNRSIVGLMIESHLHAGNQKIPEDLEDLEYGVSITDGCIDWPTTSALLLEVAEQLRSILPARVA